MIQWQGTETTQYKDQSNLLDPALHYEYASASLHCILKSCAKPSSDPLGSPLSYLSQQPRRASFDTHTKIQSDDKTQVCYPGSSHLLSLALQ